MSNNLLLGVGYDYLSAYFQKQGINDYLDSSLQITLVNFGVIFTVAFMIIVISWFWKIFKAFIYSHTTNTLLSVYVQYSLYILISIFITSQFNNLLYYQFWLFPVVMLGTYFSKLSIAIRNER